jgi:DnaJ family protein A protein 5
MDDSPRGFFGILNEFFDQLASEETAACNWTGIASIDYPPFGRAGDDYNTVAKRFYNVWSGFSTKKSFSWRDKYRLQEAPDRRVRRLMEKENKKFRDEGIREFNDAVLSLVAFVKKRDPRYIPNTQSEAERQQVLRNSAAAQAARSRAANQEKLAEYVIPDWAQSRDGDEHNDEFSMSEEEDEVEEIECVVCNKTFKSEKQFEAHERSKKHTKAVQQLRWQMRKENVNLDLDGLETDASPSPTAQQDVEDGGDGTADDPDTSPQTENVVGKSADAQTPFTNKDVSQGTPSQSDTEDDEYAPRSAVEERITGGSPKGKKAGGVEDSATDAVDSAATSVDDLTLGDQKGEGKKVGKAKLKREKKAARQDAETQASDSVSPQSYPGMYTMPGPTSDAHDTSINVPSARKPSHLGPNSLPISRTSSTPLLFPFRRPRRARRSGVEELSPSI